MNLDSGRWLARFESHPLPPRFGRLSLAFGTLMCLTALATYVGESHPTDLGYGLVVFGALVAGLINLRASLRWTGKERLAWMAVGSGGLLAGGGYLVAAFTGLTETSAFTPVDGLFLATYVVLVVGTLLLPYQGGTVVERLRVALDTGVGVAAGVALGWPLVELVTSRPGAVKGLAFLIGDAFVLAAVIVLAVRRSVYRTDLRMAFAAAVFLGNLVGDLVFVIDPASRVAVPLWIASFGVGGFMAWAHTRDIERRESTDRSPSWWRLAVPYALAAGLLWVVTADELSEADAGARFSAGGLLLVVALLIARQVAAIRENRQLVERERDALVSSVSHELRTPLTAIVGFLEVVDSAWETMSEEERRDLVHVATTQSVHLERIVGDLVQIARGRLERTELRLAIVDVEDVIREAVAVSDVPAPIEVRGRCEVTADRGRLRQVVINLLTNALRYGGGTIRVVVDSDRGFAVIEVHDNGPGVPEEYRDVIFDRFERGPQRLMSSVPGSGLGLSIARALVDAHDGTIGYRESELEGGACFTVRLPLIDDLEAAALHPPLTFAGEPLPHEELEAFALASDDSPSRHSG